VRDTSLDPYVDWALELARCASAVANYCDHVEHAEAADRTWVLNAGRTMRVIACAIADYEDEDLRLRYASRLRTVEQRNPLWEPGQLDGGALVEGASTWRALQLAQAEHDRWYHADVAGLTKLDQLRHYALHVGKLAGAVAEVAQGRTDREGFCARRLPDLLLFGIKLSTVVGDRLPNALLVGESHARSLVAA
jgi:hypothetical protein